MVVGESLLLLPPSLSYHFTVESAQWHVAGPGARMGSGNE